MIGYFSSAFAGESLVAGEVWHIVHEFLLSHGVSRPHYHLYPGLGPRRKIRDRDSRRLYSPIELEDEIRLDSTNGFKVNFDLPGTATTVQSISFNPRTYPGSPLQTVGMVASNGFPPMDWGALLNKLCVFAPLACADCGDLRYIAWQLCDSPDRYQQEYGAIHGFIQFERGSPPVNHMVLNISKNPGKNRGSSVAPKRIAAEMWVGPHFWTYAACTKEELLAADFILEKRETPHYLYIRTWPHPFTRPDGEQGRVQQKLWRLLFNEDCEWPPGSGGISDEPVGGPPDLMPQPLPAS